MATSTGSFPRHATTIDELTRPEHFYLEETDKCAFIGEYTARAGYQHSKTNRLVFNLKKGMDRRGTAEWRYKEKAITQAARTFERILRGQALNECTFVPIPPSKAIGDPAYDDRMSRVIRGIRASRPVDMRELIVQTETTTPAHDTESRPRPQEVAALYRIDETLTLPKPAALVVVDDVLTTGAHFKAAQSLLQARFPGVPVFGLFVASPDISPESGKGSRFVR